MPLQTAQEAASAKQPAVARVPFIRAAHRVAEPAFDVTATVGASTQQLGPFDVPARGFMRDILLLVTSSGATMGGGAAAADAPFSVIKSVELLDTNGHNIVAPLTGYQLYLANIFGGYRGFNDPTADSFYDGAGTSGEPAFALRIPVEITPWDGYGSLQNQSAGAPFRVRITLGAESDLFSTGPTTDPDVRIRGFLEAYTQPSGVDATGAPTEVMPPGHGAVQHWSVATPVVSASQMNVKLTRTGNLIRNLIFVHRTAAGVRSATVEPDEISFTWDSSDIYSNVPIEIMRAWHRARFGADAPTGVVVFAYTDDQDGVAGYESRHLYLPTSASTRLEYSGTFGAAGTLEIITNDLQVTRLGV